MAGVLAARGADALVFRGDDGLDELTTTGTSTVWVVGGGAVDQTSFDPASIGVPRASIADLRGGDAPANATIARSVLGGATGAVRDAVLLNAAAAIAAYEAAPGSLEDRLAAALDRATKALDDGAAAQLLDRWVEVSQSLRA
jgi:anthranilate phosphoribosyltransferase